MRKSNLLKLLETAPNNSFIITPNKVKYKYKNKRIAMVAKRNLEASLPANGIELANALDNWDLDRAIKVITTIQEKIQKYYDIYFTYYTIT